MAKLFYTLDEASSKLGKSESEVKAMVSNGQLQEFRDRDRNSAASSRPTAST